MKRIAMVLVLLFGAVSLFAGGKECQIKNGKSVELKGTLTHVAGEHAKTVFHVANSDQTYTVCHESNAKVLALGATSNTTLQVKGRLVKCDEDEGHEVLVIDDGKKL